MAPLSPGPPALAPGVVLHERYRLDQVVATGGMAQVWEAVDERLQRPVAVKVLHPHLAGDEEFVRRFRHEARAAARLNHRAIVSVYDTFHEGGLDAIVMELVDGTTLRAALAEHGRVRPARAIEIAADVADALAAAHRAEIVHRDIKPANILLTTDDRVLVADFGIAKANIDVGDQTLTSEAVLGTAKYVAPEQLNGSSVDGRADIYALGAVLYEMVAGQPPFDAETEAATALARLHQDPPRLTSVGADIPAWLDAAIMRSLARDPAHRFADAAELRDALRHAHVVDRADAIVVPDAPTTRIELDAATPAPDRDPVRWVRPLLLLLIVAVAVVVAIMLFTTDADPEPGTTGEPLARLEVAAVRSFDPAPGDGSENEQLLPAAVDDDPSTAWRTEGYFSPTIDIKPGVGLAVEVRADRPVSAIELTSPSAGWAAQLYVAGAFGATLEEWGEPVASISQVNAGATRVALDEPTVGSFVMIWFTELSPEADQRARHRVEIAELAAFG